VWCEVGESLMDDVDKLDSRQQKVDVGDQDERE
jgi:hypothetical protein